MTSRARVRMLLEQPRRAHSHATPLFLPLLPDLSGLLRAAEPGLPGGSMCSAALAGPSLCRTEPGPGPRSCHAEDERASMGTSPGRRGCEIWFGQRDAGTSGPACCPARP